MGNGYTFSSITYVCIYLTIDRTHMGKNIGVKMVDLGFDHIVSRVY